MRLTSVRLLPALVLALAVAPVVAQQPQRPMGPGGPGGRVSVGMLLGNKGVQEELKLSEEQVKKIEEIQTTIRAKHQESMKKAFESKDREKMTAVFKEIGEDLEKSLKDAGALKAEQNKRLQQILLQNSGVDAYTTKEVQEGLKLTDKQKDEIKSVSDDLKKDRQELMKSAGRDPQKLQEMQKKMQEMSKDADDKVAKLLTEDQKKAWSEMIGAKFEVKFERRNTGTPGTTTPPKDK